MRATPTLTTLALLLTISTQAHADPAADCAADAGTYLTGTVTSTPTFKPGTYLHDVELSHTHLTLKSDQDGKSYDIAIDNVFAAGYDQAGETIPAPLSDIALGDHLALCGEPFSGGMHWVHTNCGDTPTPSDPNGWLERVSPDGTPGPNLESSTEYCRLWPHHWRHHPNPIQPSTGKHSSSPTSGEVRRSRGGGRAPHVSFIDIYC